MSTSFQTHMTYKEAISYLESLIPTERNVHLNVNPLERMKALLSELGNPQSKFVSVQVSGTSGKGSTSYLLSHVLAIAGYKTGLSTSPHLERATERMKINGVEITKDRFVELLQEVKIAAQKVTQTSLGTPTYFEALVAVSFLYFAKEMVDIAVIEVGLEGKYDGTNTLMPVVGILTNISIDHVEYLGDTTEKIAHEAVSFIKPGMKVITGVTQDEVLSIVQEASERAQVDLVVLDDCVSLDVKSCTLKGSLFSFKSNERTISEILLSIVGMYQVENASLVLLALEALEKKGFKVTEQDIREAFGSASFNGRFEHFIVDGTTIILDSAHNEAKMNAFTGELERLYPERKKIFILAFKKAKNLHPIFEAIHTSADEVVFSEFHVTIDTSKNATMVASTVAEVYKTTYPGSVTYVQSTPEDALYEAIDLAKSGNGLVVITGSMYLVGQVRSILSKG